MLLPLTRRSFMTCSELPVRGSLDTENLYLIEDPYSSCLRAQDSNSCRQQLRSLTVSIRGTTFFRLNSRCVEVEGWIPTVLLKRFEGGTGWRRMVWFLSSSRAG